MRKFIEYARRRKQGFSPAAAFRLADTHHYGDTAVGLGLILILSAYLIAEAIDLFFWGQ